MKFEKLPLSIAEQIALLKKRGLQIVNEEKAVNYLQNISYYRLSAYMLPFQNYDGTHNYKQDTQFHDIIDLYVFDRELKLLLFDAIERVEIAIRTQIIYTMAMKHGAHWHENNTLYADRRVNFELQKLIAEHCAMQHKEVFIEHYLNKYTEPPTPPSWMSLEIITMGQLSKVYKALKNKEDKKQIASHFGLHPEVLQSWAHATASVRNICAHHARLWNRELGIQPTLLQSPKGAWINKAYTNNKRIYYFLCCLKYMLDRVNPGGHFAERLNKLLDHHPAVPIKYMGFSPDWKNEALWRE